MTKIPEMFLDLEKELCSMNCAETIDVHAYADYVIKKTWREGSFCQGVWLEKMVEGDVWSDAIQKALDENKCVVIPLFSSPLYIDKPLIVHSGNSLIVDPLTEIRLKPNTNTCMLRNENLVAGQNGSIAPDIHPDENIIIEGGIWNAMNNGIEGGNGNAGGGIDNDGSFIGAHGAFLFNNVMNIRIKNITITECTSHTIQMCNATRFLIDNISMPRVYRDGIHINGPADTGIIRGIRGRTGDDVVALNAWEWKNIGMSFGTISNILVENVFVEPGYVWSEIRLLAGKKLYEDGSSIDCDIRNCFFQNLKGLHTVKIYSQPNLNLGRDIDHSGSLGYLENICFADIEVDYIEEKNYYHKKDAVFEICSDICGMDIDNVKVNFPLSNELFGDLKLVAVGPLSMTCEFDSNDVSKWVEVFEPDAICTVRGLKIREIFHKNKVDDKQYIPCDIQMLAFEKYQKINPDYPNTTPRGGSGYGIIADCIHNSTNA